MKIRLEEIEDEKFAMRSKVVDVADLADSMDTTGLIHPVVVKQEESGYRLVSGHRRVMAARQLGWEDIEANIREIDDLTAMAIAFQENLERADVDPFDEAHFLDRYTRNYIKSCQRKGKKVTKKEIYKSLNLTESLFYSILQRLDVEPYIKKASPAKDESLRHVADFPDVDMSRKLVDYHPFQRSVYKNDPDKMQELVDQTITLPRPDRKKVLESIKAQPERDIEEVKREALSRPEPLPLKVYFSSDIGAGIEAAANDRHTGRRDIVQVAVKDWLEWNGYV